MVLTIEFTKGIDHEADLTWFYLLRTNIDGLWYTRARKKCENERKYDNNLTKKAKIRKLIGVKRPL